MTEDDGDPSSTEEPPAAWTLAMDDITPATGVRRQRRRRNRRRRRVRRLTTAAAIAVATLALVAVLVVSIGPLVLPYRTYFVRSGSMEPAIPTGALVFLTKVDAEDLEPGDVITFDRPGTDTTVTHRIVDVTRDGFLTKGDANDGADPWVVPRDAAEWRYALDVPYLGYVFGALASPVARGLLVGVPAVAVALAILRARTRPSYEGGSNR